MSDFRLTSIVLGISLMLVFASTHKCDPKRPPAAFPRSKVAMKNVCETEKEREQRSQWALRCINSGSTMNNSDIVRQCEIASTRVVCPFVPAVVREDCSLCRIEIVPCSKVTDPTLKESCDEISTNETSKPKDGQNEFFARHKESQNQGYDLGRRAGERP